MKIVYISNSHVPSRAANSIHVVNMCHAFAMNGHKVTLLTQHEPQFYEEKVNNIFDYYGVGKIFQIRRLVSFKHRVWMSHLYGFLCGIYIFLTQPDIVYGRDPVGLFWASLLGKEVIYEIHCPDAVRAFYAQKLFGLRGLKHIVAISGKLSQSVDGEVHGHQIIVAHDGATIRHESSVADVKKKYFSDSKSPRVGYVGQLYPGKGGEIIVDLAALMPQVIFHVFGGYKEDIYSLQQRSSSNVRFYGFVEPGLVASIISCLDIVLLPPLREVISFGATDTNSMNISDYMSPLKMFEYMGAGKAILASNISVLREVLLDGQNSLLCDPNDIEKWKVALQKLLSDKELRQALGRRAKQDYIQKYTWQKRADLVLDPDV